MPGAGAGACGREPMPGMSVGVTVRLPLDGREEACALRLQRVKCLRLRRCLYGGHVSNCLKVSPFRANWQQLELREKEPLATPEAMSFRETLSVGLNPALHLSSGCRAQMESGGLGFALTAVRVKVLPSPVWAGYHASVAAGSHAHMVGAPWAIALLLKSLRVPGVSLSPGPAVALLRNAVLCDSLAAGGAVQLPPS